MNSNDLISKLNDIKTKCVNSGCYSIAADIRLLVSEIRISNAVKAENIFDETINTGESLLHLLSQMSDSAIMCLLEQIGYLTDKDKIKNGSL